jgi:hypothetical protein
MAPNFCARLGPLVCPAPGELTSERTPIPFATEEPSLAIGRVEEAGVEQRCARSREGHPRGADS